jgi:hypothetical protein
MVAVDTDTMKVIIGIPVAGGTMRMTTAGVTRTQSGVGLTAMRTTHGPTAIQRIHVQTVKMTGRPATIFTHPTARTRVVSPTAPGYRREDQIADLINATTAISESVI